ncbi:uncharacterized protein F5891DRAFT_1028872 [Suillus fuscotomentosus]|uniref:Uncharacterized protein n=1 Tax=Suillus fuscotomentosus TaxID=1912939 RepID=A0AAD4E8H8_9AGAM|nr:uncharacterized protein F5891DRAFT_1028872 [Suillus fuscotomentosus]KAG1901322.1 hypothetical protein F5891DRAFT_1028872 [Suillus fuscotomentosus]
MESIPPSYAPSPPSPSYSPSPPSPSYSTQLLPGEQTVEETRRQSPQALNTGVFRRITDSTTLVLRDQQPGSITPVYGRNGLVRGHISLRSSEGLVEVTLKLEGHLRLETSGAAITTLVASDSYSLWSSSSTEPYVNLQPLPPSFEHKLATCTYTLSVVVSRPRRFLSSFRSSDCLVVPVCYHPRSRPRTPMLPSDVPFMTTVKSSPEEWHQLFIPSSQVYPLSETIPFHLQMRAPSSSLAPFINKSAPKHGLPVLSSEEITIRVYLLRQVVVKIFEEQKLSNQIIGEGKLTYSSPLPDNHHSYCNVPLGEGIDCLDWDGELRYTEDVTVGSFATNPLSVRDFIVLSLEPLQPLKCPLLASKHLHPIRLVTDPWSDHAVTW